MDGNEGKERNTNVQMCQLWKKPLVGALTSSHSPQNDSHVVLLHCIFITPVSIESISFKTISFRCLQRVGSGSGCSCTLTAAIGTIQLIVS